MPTKLDEAHKKREPKFSFLRSDRESCFASATGDYELCSFSSRRIKKENRSSLFCGATEIRTRDTLLGYTRFPGVPLQPLEHRSLCLDNSCHQLLVVQIYEIFFDLPLFDCIYFHHFKPYPTEYTIY